MAKQETRNIILIGMLLFGIVVFGLWKTADLHEDSDYQYNLKLYDDFMENDTKLWHTTYGDLIDRFNRVKWRGKGTNVILNTQKDQGYGGFYKVELFISKKGMSKKATVSQDEQYSVPMAQYGGRYYTM